MAQQSLKVLFLSSDTGGGHRASAEALAKQFLIHFPGSTYDLLDIWQEEGVWPYNNFVERYKHFSSHPNQWRLLYHVTNSQSLEYAADCYSTWFCEQKIRSRVEAYDPDLIVSVHPTMQRAPLLACQKISEERLKHIPFFTVCTDLGSAHSMWFQKDVERLYIASDQLARIARRRGQTPEEKIIMSGLPIRHEFSVHSERLGDRLSASGMEYQRRIRKEIGISENDNVVLLMGGGEGVGGLSVIAEQIFTQLRQSGINATICVVCGRNESLKKQLNERDWDGFLREKKVMRKGGSFLGFGTGSSKVSVEPIAVGTKGDVKVIGLGFVTRMAQYMVAADVLVSKAGPGTIAEAASVGLPVLLTSFLPGQESGNVEYVVNNGFGDFARDPPVVAAKISAWLRSPVIMRKMAQSAKEHGRPNAAAEIVLDLGSIASKWKYMNDAYSSFVTMRNMARCGQLAATA